MSDARFARLEDVILDEGFPELDLALRRGRHVDRDDAEWYAFLVDAQDHLEPLYRRYGCELVHKSDGYFYLLPTNDRLGKRHLSPGEMLVGQGLALAYLDPNTVESGGVVTRDLVLSHLAGVVGDDVLVRAFNPKRRRHDERIASQNVRTRVSEALRRLASLGFLDALDGERYRLRASLLRFAEPLRGAGAPLAQVASMVEAGEIVLTEGEDGAHEGDEAAPDVDDASEDEGAPDEDDARDDDSPDSEGDSEEDAAGEDREPAP